MIYDCFPFFNELDILKMRLEIMDPIVDKFVIEEAAYTFSSEPKPLYFQENKEMFKKWEHKTLTPFSKSECKKLTRNFIRKAPSVWQY